MKKSKRTNKYRYQVIINENDLSRISDCKLFNLVKDDNRVLFNCNARTKRKIKNYELDCMIIDKLDIYYKKNKIKILITMFFLLIILLIYTLNQLLIRNVNFKKQDYYDQNVYEYVLSNTTKIGPFYILERSINDISKSLRKEFYEYAYIGLTKKGSNILIEIEIQDIPKKEEQKIDMIGEYIAKEDATILEVNLTSGQMLVSHHDIVKKGDIIATSNLQYKENLYAKEKMVPLKGYVIGKTKSYIEIEILKSEEIEIFTNRISKTYTLKLNEERKNPFKLNFTKTKTIFKLGDFEIYKKTYFEKEIVVINRNYEEAINLSELLIKQKFEQKRTTTSEKIVSLNLINYSENEIKFVFRYLISSIQNIVEFREFVEVNK